MTKPTITVTTAYRCNDYSTVGWAVELNNDTNSFGVGGTWGEALGNAIYEMGDESCDVGGYKVVVPNKVRNQMREQIRECGVEDNFFIKG